jgi:mannosyl-3-phosphoglycerate phosphatase
VVTDLDGTLLDHSTYEPGPASEALHGLLAEGVTVVFCSSKTRAEQEEVAKRLGVRVPLVVENGAAVILQSGNPIVLGQDYADVRDGLLRAAAEADVAVRGYGDMSVNEVADLTGLSRVGAERAMMRQYTESFVICDPSADAAQRLRTALSRHSLRMLRGARMWTACGGHDKGIAVRRLRDELGDPELVVGIGDHENDAEMLAEVGLPMLVQQPDGTWTGVDVPGLVLIEGAGPGGWVRAAERVRAEVDVRRVR